MRRKITRKPVETNRHPVRCHNCMLSLEPGDGRVVRPDGAAAIACPRCAGIEPPLGTWPLVSVFGRPGDGGELSLIPCGRLTDCDRRAVNEECAAAEPARFDGLAWHFPAERASALVRSLKNAGIGVALDHYAANVLRDA